MRKISYIAAFACILLCSCQSSVGPHTTVWSEVTLSDCDPELAPAVLEVIYDQMEDADNALTEPSHYEWIRITETAENSFAFTHHALYTCCMSPKATIKYSSNTITLRESERGMPCDCICPIDVDFQVSGLQYGTYKFKRYFRDKQIININITQAIDTIILLK